jgi:putative ABC transport system permease protein
MRRVLHLAWRYVAYDRIKTAILVVCLTLTIVLPLTAHVLIAHFGRSLMARAQATPLVVGAKGDRFDLVLEALYFGAADVEPIHAEEVDEIAASGLAMPIPLHLRFTARGFPIVGTSLEYFDFRNLRVLRGTKPLQLGQAVLGAEVAAELGLAPGDHLFSDQQSLYDITKTYPLKMHVVGVLAETDSPDDRAVFVDVKTAYVIAGITHGHRDVVKTADDAIILKRDEDSVTTNDAIFEYNEVTPENLNSFHTHANPGDCPLSAIIVVPNDDKAATMLKARYNLSETCRMLRPVEVIEELMGLVFRIKRFFDANFALILLSTALFIVLVVLLSRRIRKREMETMFKIGCSRTTVFWLQAAELSIVLLISVAAAGAISLAAVLVVPRFLNL